ncbi:hypothetical protein ABZ851_06715 [Streptomyces sp. NPDC047049]|uniref:hypothetical protein n=1 Tax=Streptomyces sp. NPDC047049 TaxID=3156688 RepID=UPI0033E6E63B
MPGDPGDLTLLYRAGNAAQLVLREELERIAAARGAALHYLLGPSDGPFDPLAPRALRNLVPDLVEHDVYLCGPPGMSTAAAAALVSRTVTPAAPPAPDRAPAGYSVPDRGGAVELVGAER